jgi:hypothetical protein
MESGLTFLTCAQDVPGAAGATVPGTLDPLLPAGVVTNGRCDVAAYTDANDAANAGACAIRGTEVV